MPSNGEIGYDVALLVEPRYLTQLQPQGLLAALARRGASVAVLDPDTVVHDLGSRPAAAGWLGTASLVVARGRSATLLTALAVAERFGVPTVNCGAAVAAVRDKAAMAAGLVTAGLPTPRTWVGPPAELARALVPTDYPVVLKPVFGDNGRGIHLVAGPEELAQTPWTEETALAQSLVPGEGDELKVYVAGERVWAVKGRRRFGEPGPQGAPDLSQGPPPVELSGELAELARACGAVFGLELFGVDCLLTPRGPVVVEVNDFPNYRGVPDADDVLADHILAAVRQSRGNGRP